jgi:integrase/recombinase XerC
VRAQLTAFIEYLRLNRNASAHTAAAYESDLTQFLDFAAQHLGHSNLEPGDLELGTVRGFMAELYRQGHARTSVARKLSALRAFGRYLRREGWIDADPAALAASPKRERKVPAHLSIDEMTRLLEMPDVSDPLGCRDRAILELFYASGLRLSELVGLNLDDINLKARMVRVMGKGAKERQVPFNETTGTSLSKWRDVRRVFRATATRPERPAPRAQSPRSRALSREPLFLNFRGNRLTGRSVQRLVARYVAAARGSVSARTRCDTLSPHTCWSAERICGRSRSCSATCSCRRRNATPT